MVGFLDNIEDEVWKYLSNIDISEMSKSPILAAFNTDIAL
jgi:hypothetical protein